MELKPIAINIDDYPVSVHPYLEGAAVYDSSCSENAKVIYIDKDEGYFLKTSAPGALKRENVLTRLFHKKGLTAPVLEYINGDSRDFLLTEKIRGDDCTAAKFLENPEKLCDVLAETLAALHSVNPEGFLNHSEFYRSVIDRNYADKHFDLSYQADYGGFASSDETYQYIDDNFHLLQSDTLIHGDYCLPNIILDDWRFSGFVDVGNGGAGDRHIDLFWGVWTLRYNLGTDKYRERFFDVYGRDKIDKDRLRLVGACEVFG